VWSSQWSERAPPSTPERCAPPMRKGIAIAESDRNLQIFSRPRHERVWRRPNRTINICLSLAFRAPTGFPIVRWLWYRLLRGQSRASRQTEGKRPWVESVAEDRRNPSADCSGADLMDANLCGAYRPLVLSSPSLARHVAPAVLFSTKPDSISNLVWGICRGI
jgi:hypothetical protein